MQYIPSPSSPQARRPCTRLPKAQSWSGTCTQVHIEGGNNSQCLWATTTFTTQAAHRSARVPAANAVNALLAPHAGCAIEVEEAAGAEVNPLLALAVVVQAQLLGLPSTGPHQPSRIRIMMQAPACRQTRREGRLHARARLQATGVYLGEVGLLGVGEHPSGLDVSDLRIADLHKAFRIGVSMSSADISIAQLLGFETLRLAKVPGEVTLSKVAARNRPTPTL